MQLFENIGMALTSVRSNKMRSLLTMLGIIIGIAAVIAIETVGNSMTGSVMDSKSVGGDTVWVRPPSPAFLIPKPSNGLGFFCVADKI